MFIREMSDAHLEICPYYIPPMVGDAESVLALSGDILTAHTLGSTALQFFESASKRFKHVVYIPGNHEYYRDHIDHGDGKIERWLKEKGFHNVHYLNMASVVIDDVAFIGATLWTDVNKGDPISRIDVEGGLNDYNVIRAAGYRKLRSNDTICKHLLHKQYIFDQIANFRTIGVRKIVVMSHHAPSEMSVHPRFKGNELNAAYFSNLENEVMDSGADLWFHGHTHDSFDYYLENTRVICNPRGYSHILRKHDYLDMMDMPEVDPNTIEGGELMANFDNIFHQENKGFNPFFRLEI